MKHAIHLTTLVVIAGLLFFSSCSKEEYHPNGFTNTDVVSAMLQGAWVYQSGEEVWHLNSYVVADTSIVDPSSPLVKDLRFMADGTAYIEFYTNSDDVWTEMNNLLYEEREFLWAISESGTTLMLTDANWEKSKWQILSLTYDTLTVSFNLTGGTIPSGMEVTCTYNYRHR